MQRVSIPAARPPAPARHSLSASRAEGEEATIGWLREAEIKHGRIAMAGFLGFIVSANDIRLQGMAPELMAIPKGIPAPAVWDAMPEIAKWQVSPAAMGPLAPGCGTPALC